MIIPKIVFTTLELGVFILPAIPSSIYVRFSILSTYFVLYYFDAQIYYQKIKYRFTSNF
jgi:hypothetical protein